MNSWRTVVDWDRQGWRDDAACRETSADLFFPAGHTGPAGAQTDMAKAVCRACPVQMACLRFALDTNEDHGIWGGLDEDERRRLRRSTRELRSVRK